MSKMDVWDWALLVGGAYLAISTLISLMRVRRIAVLQEISSQASIEKRRQDLDKKKQDRRKLREQKRDRAA